MARIRWSPRAASDLEEACEYIARDSQEYAKVLARQVNQIVKSLPQLPNAGRVVPEWGDPKIRERFAGDYRIIYRVGEELIEVVRILHGARLLDRE